MNWESPNSNIVSCLVCHGPNAEGVREIPRLGGLSYSYLKKKTRAVGRRISCGRRAHAPNCEHIVPKRD